MADYPVRLKRSDTFDALPEGNSRDIFNAWRSEDWLAIGTPAELRELIADGILPSDCHFTIEAVAA